MSALREKFKFDKNSPWHFYRAVLLYSLIVSACITLPFIIYELVVTGKAVFLYYGDYNAQQIPFYRHSVDMVHSGNFGWDWMTDLGSNFIGSYSYYLLGSPFFWLMAAFPASWAPYLMAPMYMVKYVCAAVLAYCYLQRFVKNKNHAVIGALLYSFSGFQIYNTFFNQFHDVVALFPLLLIGIEELVQNDRKGLFAVAVMMNALVNYFMFAGQAVFCVIYFLFRISGKGFGITLKKFAFLAIEAVLGFMMSMFLFLPAALALSGNGRVDRSYTGTIAELFESLFNGVKGWFTGDKTDYFKAAGEKLDKLFFWRHNGEGYWQRYGQIFESYFFPPDIPSRVNFFYGHETRWASISMYLPMFSLTGVFALFTVKGRKWLKSLMIFLVLCSFVPVLNSIFFLFNSSYYARWLYMMIMMFVLATVISLDDARTKWKVPTAIMTFVSTAVAVPLGLLWYYSEDKKTQTLGYPPFPARFWIYVAIAFLGIILTAWLIRRYRGTKKFDKAALISVCFVIVLYSCVHIINGKQHSHASAYLTDNCIEGVVELPDPTEEFYRIDQFRSSSISTIDNLGLYWNYPSMECFHTVVPPSIMAFYPKFGVTRDVGSRAESSLYGIRALTSTKYSFIQSTRNARKEETTIDPVAGEETGTGRFTEKHNIHGFKYFGTQNGFDIYENENYLNMGFAYDEFMTESDFEKAYTAKNNRHLLLCAYLVVPDDKADFYSEFMTRVSVADKAPATQATFDKSVAARRSEQCDSFEYSSYGFKAHIELEKPAAVFFSVPYEEYGWSATVNGEKAEVLKATYGFVAVKCGEGENVIEFSYTTPGLFVGGEISLGEVDLKVPFGGAAVSAAGLLLFAVYMVVFKVIKKEKCGHGLVRNAYYDGMGAYDVAEEKSDGGAAESELPPDGESGPDGEPGPEAEAGSEQVLPQGEEEDAIELTPVERGAFTSFPDGK